MERRDFIKRAGMLAGAMCVDLPAFSQKVAAMGPARLKLGIISDIHLRDKGSEHTFRHTLEYYRDNEVDGVIIAGDMADWGLESQLKLVADTWYKVFPKDKLPNGQHIEKLFVYGNHDIQGCDWSDNHFGMSEKEWLKNAIGKHPAESWKRYFHEKYQPIYMKTIKGYHFIGSHWDTVQDAKQITDFISAHSSELQGSNPFFYIQHQHPRNTTYGKWAWGADDGQVTEALSHYPNAIAFSGHSHMPLNDEMCLWQESFTSIGTASLSYLCPLPGRENARIYGGWKDKFTSEMAPIGYSDDGRQGMLLTVYDDNITIERREFIHDQQVADNWIIPWPVKDAQMSFEHRRQKAVAPQFAKGDKVSIRYIEKGKDRQGDEHPQFEARFPIVLKSRTGVRAIDYEVQLEQEFVDIISVACTKRVYSKSYYLGEAQDTEDVTCLFGKAQIPIDRRWRIAVRPCESFSKKGEPIYSDWQDKIEES